MEAHSHDLRPDFNRNMYETKEKQALISGRWVAILLPNSPNGYQGRHDCR
jgi:hypothetical protein